MSDSMIFDPVPPSLRSFGGTSRVGKKRRKWLLAGFALSGSFDPELRIVDSFGVPGEQRRGYRCEGRKDEVVANKSKVESGRARGKRTRRQVTK